MNKRQHKKKVFGYRAGSCKLKRRIKAVTLLDKPRTIYDGFGISDVFCPYCGCEIIEWSGNRASYPELWDIGYCARCGEKVAEADNSPYLHILRVMLEYPEEPFF